MAFNRKEYNKKWYRENFEKIKEQKKIYSNNHIEQRRKTARDLYNKTS
jgi:hypothetical protein